MSIQIPELVPGYRADLAAAIAAMPASQHIGLKVIGFAPGISVIELPIRREITFDGTTVQGGLVGTLADYAAVSATIVAKPDGWFGSTVNFQVHNLDQARGLKLLAIGRCIRSGSRTGLGSAEVFAINGDNRVLVATAMAGCQYVAPVRHTPTWSNG
jgi:acyl-coenzyme A thioesterase PaaI-like protein